MDPSRTLEGAQTLVVGARSYWRKSPEAENLQEPIGRVALYALEDHYQQLRNGLEAIVQILDHHGFNSRILIDDNALVDREAAYRAGIGWYGKTPTFCFQSGELVRFGVSYHRRIPLPIFQIKECGTFERCIPACPTQAITAPGVLDANKCLAWLLQSEGQFPIEFREALGDRITAVTIAKYLALRIGGKNECKKTPFRGTSVVQFLSMRCSRCLMKS